MSSFDHGSPTRRRFGARALLFALAAVALGACSVQPLYGPGPEAGGGTVKSNLARISVDPVSDRVSQQVRNKVIFQLTGGQVITDPVYNMHLTVTSRETGMGITTIEAAPVYSISVAATFTVTKNGTEEKLIVGTAHASASYNRVNQAYANTRAKIDAENRAAEQVGNEIAIRAAAALAAGS